jgi:hypothetical protein
MQSPKVSEILFGGRRRMSGRQEQAGKMERQETQTNGVGDTKTKIKGREVAKKVEQEYK